MDDLEKYVGELFASNSRAFGGGVLSILRSFSGASDVFTVQVVSASDDSGAAGVYGMAAAYLVEFVEACIPDLFQIGSGSVSPYGSVIGGLGKE